MRFLIVLVSAMVFPSVSLAAPSQYACSAKANPARGFNSEFSILVSPAAKGGEIYILAKANKRLLAKVTETGTLKRNDPSTSQAFDLTLNYIHEEDVSGVAPSKIDLIGEIIVFRGELPGGDEVLVYQLFNGTKQIGGTIVISGMGTACIPAL